MASKQAADRNKKLADKQKELQEFVARFSANASKSKQATSRKKLLEKINLDEIKPSSRRYPAIIYTQEREAGDQILEVEGLAKSTDAGQLFSNFDLVLDKGDKVAFIANDSLATTAFFDIINGELEADAGEFKWGQTITNSYLPLENAKYFDTKLNLVDWLRQFSKEKDETYIRGFLGKMLFTGEESQKEANVLSGGEKVRCMVSRMMMKNANVLVLDEPTNHLDLESITAFNNSLKDFKGTVLFTSHDHEFVQTVANRIVEIFPGGILDKRMTYDEYLESERVQEQREEMMAMNV